jgi:DNA helicase TIP49 (TBP-interacting protein)
MSDGEYHQMQLERQEMLEQALRRAINHSATEDDWAVIRYECGLSAQKSKGEYYESHS